MNYQTFEPHADLASVVKCYWTLEVPLAPQAPKQRIVPDGCLEMIFILGDNMKRYLSETEFIIQPRAIVVGQITEPFVIQPTGYVHCFAVRFYPFGFANFVNTPIKKLADKETPIAQLFDGTLAENLAQEIISAVNDQERIAIVEAFLLNKFDEKAIIDQVVKTTIETLLLTKGSRSINNILQDEPSKRRQLERKFFKQVGLSPKQLGKVIRLQAALKMLLTQKTENLTRIAYDSEYYDQAHFNRDFKELTGINPKDFLENDKMQLSTVFYTKD